MTGYINIAIGLCLLFITPFAAHAQDGGPLTQKALKTIESNDIMLARDQILVALKDKNESSSAFTWHAKGFIYKEIYKKIDKESRYSENREIAVDAILHSMEIDDDRVLEEANVKAMIFLSLSYYNDAVDIIGNLNEENYEEPLKYYKRYRQLHQLCETEFDFKDRDTEFYSNYAYNLKNLSDRNSNLSDKLGSMAIANYEQAISINAHDYPSNYNLAVIHYNRGVKKIRAINHQTEIFELIIIQEECLKDFKLALPYMNETYKLESKDKDALLGLMAIYKALNDDAETEKYRQELERLIKSGEIRGK